MKAKHAASADRAADEAARWFVRVDGGEPGAAEDCGQWLAARTENERALERVELAVVLGRRLAAEPGSALYAEAARAARSTLRRTPQRTLALGGTLAAALLATVLLVPDAARRPNDAAPQTLRAAQSVAVDAPTSSVAVLPAGVVVDASAVAVLPFAAAGDAALITGLERDVVAALRGVPGLYVIAGEAVRPYAGAEITDADMGSQLGARGIVDAAVEVGAGRVRVSAELRDAATGATLWRAELDRPVDELSAIRYEIAENVAAAMLDSDLRERSANAGRASAPVAVGKPLLDVPPRN